MLAFLDQFLLSSFRNHLEYTLCYGKELYKYTVTCINIFVIIKFVVTWKDLLNFILEDLCCSPWTNCYVTSISNKVLVFPLCMFLYYFTDTVKFVNFAIKYYQGSLDRQEASPEREPVMWCTGAPSSREIGKTCNSNIGFAR